MAWNAKAYFEAKRVADSLPEDIDLSRLLNVAGSPEGRRAVLDTMSSRIRKREVALNADLMAPHLSFNEYAADDETAHPCRCWIAGRENRRANSSDCLHPGEYLDGVQARYEYDNDI
jgi:hypothetical protein